MSQYSEEKGLIIVQETEAVIKNKVSQSESKGKRYFCHLCCIYCYSEKNFENHVTGQKHKKKIQLLYNTSERAHQVPSQQNINENAQNRSNQPKKTLKKSSELNNSNFKKKDQNNQNFVPATESVHETMNNSNRYYQNTYNGPDFDKRYNNSRYYSNDYRNEKHYYNDRHNWKSHSKNSAQNHNFNYRSRRHFYSPDRYNMSHESKFSLENKHSFFGPFNYYGESENPTGFEQNFEHNMDEDSRFAGRNPFKQHHSEEVASSSKSKEKPDSEANATKTKKTGDSSTNTSILHSKVHSSASKRFTISPKTGNKRVIFRSRSLSSSESDKKRKDRTDLADSSESEEQRIQEWTNSLLETNHNQITRLVNPSNHKEKAAVNHLITKFSKSKRKEILTRTLRTNSSELIDEDDRDICNENVSAEVESINTQDEEISIILDSEAENVNLEQNFSFPSLTKTDNSKCNTNQDQISENILKSNKSPMNQTSKMYNKNDKNFYDTLNKSLDSNSSPCRTKEKFVKRKDVNSDAKTKKKRKTSSINSSNAISITESDDLSKDGSTTPKNFSNSTSSKVVSDQNASLVKEEIGESVGIEVDPANSITSEKKSEENVFNPDVTVETLIQLFASGNVKVKEEFNDPVMDALRGISPDELINAYSNNPVNACETVSNQVNTSSISRKNSKDKSPSETSAVDIDKNTVDPVILGSVAIEDNESPVTETVKNSSARTCTVNANASLSMTIQAEPKLSTSSTFDKSDMHNPPLTCIDNEKNLDPSLLNFSELNNARVELPSYLNKLINKLQDITSEEEKIKENLIEAKSKINEYTSLLEEWKEKKKMLNEQEDNLRKQRNDIIKLMQNAVKTDSDSNEEESRSAPLENDTLNDQPTSSKKQKFEKNNEGATIPEILQNIPSSLSKKSQKRKETKSFPEKLESDEVIIIPTPQKPKPPEIIICDDEENVLGSQSRNSKSNTSSCMTSKQKSSIYDLKTVDAHTTVINCLVVFEDFLYTCSNDNTAKRFSLKDASLFVTYLHSAKNITEIVVEKVQNEALVFTSSSRLISLFIAASGTKIKNFYPPCAVMSICKGWGKFYAGLANGSVNVYNWKYEEIEIVKTEQSVSRIATADQGRLHVLVILSSKGNIAIRDAETGLLIRYVKINIKHPSWMCLHNDLVYLSSSDKSLTILDIMSGEVEKNLFMNCHTTGLAVHDDYIFTISYNGVINCYNKNNGCDKKVFYGAGKGGLTCVYIYQNWVFTGNRKGDISLFHFDPNSLAVCEFARCDIVYGLKEDLEYHIEKDHLQKKKLLTLCNWHGCDFRFPRGSDIVDKMNHIRTHIYKMNNTPTIL